MTSPYVAARDAIVAALEALTPQGVTSPGYKHLGSRREQPSGAGAHRVFWFDHDGIRPDRDFGATLSYHEHRVSLTVHLSGAGLGPTAMDEAIANEGCAIQRLINATTWVVSGVDFVRAGDLAVVEVGDEDRDLVLALVIATQET
jgi:hypothetical protein